MEEVYMLLEVKDLKVSYGNIEALHGISFNVDKGEIVTLIGANGTGKTSTLMSLARLGRPEAPVVKSGEILFEGNSILKTEPYALIQKKMMCLVPEGRHIFGNLTVEENLQMATYGRKNCPDRDSHSAGLYDLVYDLFPRLYERRKQRSELLSGGEQQMLAMGRALMSHPKLLMLDEPSMGLSPLLVDEVFSIIKDLNKEGTTILLVEQNAGKSLAISDRAYVLENGKIVLSGTGEELLSSEEVKKAYLGG